jgi:hypothetical protein
MPVNTTWQVSLVPQHKPWMKATHTRTLLCSNQNTRYQKPAVVETHKTFEFWTSRLNCTLSLSSILEWTCRFLFTVCIFSGLNVDLTIWIFLLYWPCWKLSLYWRKTMLNQESFASSCPSQFFSPTLPKCYTLAECKPHVVQWFRMERLHSPHVAQVISKPDKNNMQIIYHTQ